MKWPIKDRKTREQLKDFKYRVGLLMFNARESKSTMTEVIQGAIITIHPQTDRNAEVVEKEHRKMLRNFNTTRW